MKNPKVLLALVAYMATIPAANWMISNVGTPAFPGGPHMIPVGFGLTAPSGLLLIGAALAARDVVHRLAGWRLALAAIAVGVALSWLVNPAIALASATAFALGELADLAVFAPLARRSRQVDVTRFYSADGRLLATDRRPFTNYARLAVAVVASGVVGGAIDTFVFLRMAFGSVDFWQGQLVGKTFVACACGLALWGGRAVSQRVASR